MASDRDVVRLVGQDETSGLVARHQLAQRRRISCAAADDPVRPEVKDIAHAGDGDCAGLRRERPLFDRIVSLIENNVVDLVEREASDLDRRLGQNQLRELDFEFSRFHRPFSPDG
jgi:hypothetical protein